MPSNPLLPPWPGPYGGVPPWQHVHPGYLPEALQASLDEQRVEIEAIVRDAEPPTFENTIAALERSGQTRERVERLFGVACESFTTPEIQAMEEEWQPRLSAATDAVLFNAALFQRIDAVHASGPSGLAPDQWRLTCRVHDTFVRHGARLDGAAKERLSVINQELALHFARFRQKVLADEDAWTVLEGEPELAGLPASLRATVAAAAAERGLTAAGALLNTRSSVDPFLTFSSRRDLRERVWRKFKMRGDNGDANDTNATIVSIVKLRAERARLLGFASHAHWQMADSMAKEPQRARALMMAVWPAAVSAVRNDVAAMRAIAAREGMAHDLEPWDYLYYAEKLRKERYDLDQGELKPYFALDNMVAASLWSASQCFDLSFEEITGRVPTFHPEMRVWEVKDAPSGRHRGLFYLDNFARPGKRSGAWACNYRDQHSLDGPVTPIVSNNNNFVKASAGETVLISFDDAETLFHEFGHALHALLQEVRYPTLGETPGDFVEYPSQVNENWLLTREVLDRFARHHETGAPMPQELLEKVERARRFNQGYATVEYLAAAILDMDLHSTSDGAVDPRAFETESLARIGMPREVALRHRLPQFDHLFGSDFYSAGYYSYLWADVMAADTWEAFLEAGGPWDKALARRYRQHILSEGNATDREVAYRLFRGRDPESRALFAARGFPVV